MFEFEKMEVFPAPGMGLDSRCVKQCNKEGAGAKGGWYCLAFHGANLVGNSRSPLANRFLVIGFVTLRPTSA